MRRGSGEPLLLRCRWLLPCARCGVLEDVDVLVEDGVVRAVVSRGSRLPSGSFSGHVVDCGRRRVGVPCLYNAHTHAAMVLLRGYYDDSELFEWLSRMWFVEKRLTPEVVYHASRIAVVEMLSSATCGFLDMYFMPWETARAAWEAGVRAGLGPVIMGRGVDPWRAVEEASRFVEAVEARYGPLVRGVYNVHSIYAAPLEAVRLAAREAAARGRPLHIHVSETRREVYEAKKRYGVFPLELLDRLGAVQRWSVLVHGGWLASWEVELAARRGATLVHCPASNMKLATAGHFPLYEARRLGANVAIGTDGAASNNTLDMLREMRLAVLLQRHSYWDTRVAAVDVLEAAAEGGAGALGLEGGGRLEPGAPGDVAVLSLERPGLWPPRRGRLVSHIVYSAAAGDAWLVAVAGRVVYAPWMRERLERLLEESLGVVEGFLEKVGEGVDPEPPCSPPSACLGGPGAGEGVADGGAEGQPG